jgi:hypothetical protein
MDSSDERDQQRDEQTGDDVRDPAACAQQWKETLALPKVDQLNCQ